MLNQGQVLFLNQILATEFDSDEASADFNRSAESDLSYSEPDISGSGLLSINRCLAMMQGSTATR